MKKVVDADADSVVRKQVEVFECLQQADCPKQWAPKVDGIIALLLKVGLLAPQGHLGYLA